MKSLILTAAAIGAAAIATTASAQATSNPDEVSIGLYGNLGYSHGQVNSAGVGDVTGRLGWRFNRYVGVEGELGAGVNSGSRTDAVGPTNVDIKPKWSSAAYVVGFWPVTPQADIFIRGGYGESQFKVDPAALASYNARESGWRYGVGGQYSFDGHNGVRLDYTRYDGQNVRDPGGFFGPSGSENVWSVAYVRKF